MCAWWEADARTYLGRVSKAQIFEAVAEGAGAPATKRLEGLKKGPMLDAAAQTLADKQ